MIKFFKNKIKHIKGMTLVELMVVISIFTIITGITIFDYGSYNSNVSLTNLADDIALSIRKAQSYAIGMKVSDTMSATRKFEHGYGIHITTSNQDIDVNPMAGSNKSFVLYANFADLKEGINFPYKYFTNKTCGISLSQSHECLEILSINSKDKITGIFLDKGIGYENMTEINLNSIIDISFHRPNPDAYFCYSIPQSSSNCLFSDDISRVAIEVTSSNLKQKYISVYKTGQINVQDALE